MQRFKKHMDSQKFKGERFWKCANPITLKFVYGANGTLTQAARWRIDMLAAIGLITAEQGYFVTQRRREIDSLRHSSHEGGCYLP